MANSAKLIAGASAGWVSALTNSTDLDTKSTGTAILASPAITNGTGLDLLMDLSLQLSSVNPSGAPYWEVHLLPLLADGTTYADRSNQTLVDQMAVTTGTSAKNAASIGIPLPPGDFKIQIVNQMGVSTVTTNTFKYRTYNYNLNG